MTTYAERWTSDVTAVPTSIRAPEPTPDLPLLRKVLAHVEALPAAWEDRARTEDAWSQQVWGARSGCRTACCLAGWTVHLAPGVEALEWRVFGDGDYLHRVTLPDGTVHSVKDAARELLGLTHEEAGALFAGHNSRADLRRVAEGIAARAGEVL